MSQEERIGQKARRVYNKSNYTNTKWHTIESQVADRIITKCGRQMNLVTGAKSDNHLEYHDGGTQGFLRAENVCMWCG